MKFAVKTASLLLSLSICANAGADPLSPKQVPADAKWVLHVDMDAARDTKLWSALENQLSTKRDFQDGIGKIEQVTNAQFPRDLHDVTLYGRSAEDQAGVVIVHAHMDRQRVVTVLQMNLGYSSKDYGDHQLLTWHDDDKDKQMFGSFFDDSTVIIGQSEELIRSALDVMDDKSEHLKLDSPLAAGAKPQLLAFVAARDMASLKKEGQPQSPVVQQIQSAWVSLTESEGNAVVKANVLANSAENAQQLNQLLDGVRAMVSLTAGKQPAQNDEQSKATAISSLLKTLSIKRDDKLLTVDWPIAIEKGRGGICDPDRRQSSHHAALTIHLTDAVERCSLIDAPQ